MKMKKVDDPICQQCLKEEESVEHFLRECPAFTRERYQNLGGITITREMLKDIKLKKILSFIRESKRFEED